MKKKLLIYQYYWFIPKSKRTVHIMNDENRYYDYSRQSIQAYAQKCGADYKFLSEKHPVDPFYGIFLPFTQEWCHEYDMICWIDSDILATITAPNIFEIASNDCVSANFMETQNRWKGNQMFSWWADKGHINSGVVVFPRVVYTDMIDFLKNLKERHENRTVLETSLGNFDQAIVNLFVREQNEYQNLSDTFNYHLSRKSHQDRFDKGLIHYHRDHKSLLVTDFEDERILK